MFLVDASQYPGPAMFQGISLILIAIFAPIYLNYKDKKLTEELRKKYPHLYRYPKAWDKPPEEETIVTKKPVKHFWDHANDPGNSLKED